MARKDIFQNIKDGNWQAVNLQKVCGKGKLWVPLLFKPLKPKS
jgi:hypothetical protein